MYRNLVALFLFLALSCGISGAQEDRRAAEEKSRKAEISRLFENYDKSVVPRSNNGGPVEVEVSMYVLDIWTVSEENMEFTMDVYFRQGWKDSRLASNISFSTQNNAVFDAEFAEKMWIPDTFFANARDTQIMETIQKNVFVRISSDGSILHSVKLKIAAGCHMDLHDYPLDKQTCNLEMESYGYKAQDILYKWSKSQSNPVMFYEGAALPHFKLIKVINQEMITSLSIGNYSRLCTEFVLQRQACFYIYHYYMPLIFLVIVTWFALFVSPEFPIVRCLLALVPMTLIVFLWFGTTFPLRRSTTSTRLDCYMVNALIFSIVSLVETVVVIHLKSNQKKPPEESVENPREFHIQVEEKGTKISKLSDLKKTTLKRLASITSGKVDIACRFLFPFAFALYNLIYWLR